MTRDSILAGVAAAIAELDVSEENARVAELEANIASMEGAIGRADARRQEIAELLRPYRGSDGLRNRGLDDMDGGTVADALLAGSSPAEAAATRVTRDELEGERDALGLAIADLSRRVGVARREIDAARWAARVGGSKRRQPARRCWKGPCGRRN